MDCPCGSLRPLAACCGRFLDAGFAPPTAEALMRSRFSAYALGRVDYIVETELPPPPRASIEETSARTRFTRLEVLDVVRGGPHDETGEVAFRAHFDAGRGAESFEERSSFLRAPGSRLWRYLAQAPRPVGPARPVGPSRNGPCPCGSGKKYKRCCG